MGLVDLFRPKWKHSKASVRAEALRALGADQHEVLVEVARTDADDDVRRLAIEKLDDPAVLSSLADGDGSPSAALARSRAVKLWTERAVRAKTAEAAEPSLRHLTEARQLARVIDRAAADGVREAALSRLTDDKVLAELAREATEPAVRRRVVETIADPEILRSIAITGEPRDAAIAAIERLDDTEALELIIKKAQRKNLRNRAKRRLAVVAPPPPEPEPTGPTRQQLHFAEQLRLLAIVEAAMVGKAYDEADVVTETSALWAKLADKDSELAARFDHAVERFAVEREEHAQQLERDRAQAEADAAKVHLEATRRARDEARRRDQEERRAEAERKRAERAEAERAAEPTEQERAELAAGNAERLEQMCVALERAATGSKLKAAQGLLREASSLFAESLVLPSAGREEQLRTRYEAARTELHTVVQTLAENEKWRDWANLTKQRSLAERAQAIAATADTDPDLATKLKALQDEWKSVRSVGAGKGEALWDKFRGACDQIYERVKQEQAANLARREELCERAESWQDSTDFRGTAAAMKDLQAVWKTLGPVGRADDARTWSRFRTACDAFFSRRQAANEADQAEQHKNAAKKEVLIAKVEALVDGIVDDKTLARASEEAKRLQRAWRDVGHAPRKDADALHKRFRGACDAVFQRLERLEDERAAAEAKRIADDREAIEASLADVDGDPKRLVELWSRVHDTGDEALRRRCYEACAGALAASAAVFAGTELAPVNAMRRKRKLCERVEALAVATETTLADRLEQALANNALAGASGDAEHKLSAARQAWLRIGPTPSDEGRELDARFEAAVAAATGTPPPP